MLCSLFLVDFFFDCCASSVIASLHATSLIDCWVVHCIRPEVDDFGEAVKALGHSPPYALIEGRPVEEGL